MWLRYWNADALALSHALRAPIEHDYGKDDWMPETAYLSVCLGAHGTNEVILAGETRDERRDCVNCEYSTCL